MNQELSQQLDRGDHRAGDDQQFDRPHGNLVQPLDAGELRGAPRTRKVRPRAARHDDEHGHAHRCEHRVPRSCHRRSALCERLDDHLDAHEPAAQHRVAELQEHASDERERHHLGDARDRVTEGRAADDVRRDQEHQREDPHHAGAVHPRHEHGERAPWTSGRCLHAHARVTAAGPSRAAAECHARASRSCTRAARRLPVCRAVRWPRPTASRYPASPRATSVSPPAAAP